MVNAQFPWEHLEQLVGRKLKTLEEAHPFEIDRLEPEDVVLTISTGSERWITRAAFRRAWVRIAAGDEISRIQLDEIEERQGTYIAAILAKIPGVEFAYDPIRVYPKLQSAHKPTNPEWQGVTDFLNWANDPDNCPFLDEEKQQLWDTVVSGCGSVLGWEELDLVLRGLMNEYSDSKLKAVPRRLRREAREFREE